MDCSKRNTCRITDTVAELPEGWSLPSYLVIVIQIANVGPIAYTIWNVLKPDKRYDNHLIFLMVLIGCIASLLLSFFWTHTSVFGNKEYSTALLALTFILSLIACTSSVVFLPYMDTLKYIYMKPFFVGMGFSGLVPSLVSLFQGVGQVDCQNVTSFNMTSNTTSSLIQSVHQPPKFPVKYFFLFIFAMILACGIAFVLLNYLPYCKSEHVSTIEKNTKGSEKSIQTFEEETTELTKYQDTQDEIVPKMSTFTYIVQLVLVGWINVLLHGVLLSVQSYACLPYGIEYYHLSVTLSNIADPVAGFFAFFLIIKSLTCVSLISLIGTMISVYIVFIAVMQLYILKVMLPFKITKLNLRCLKHNVCFENM